MNLKSFAEVFDEALCSSSYSLGEISRRLGQNGFRINKATLTRWRSGQNKPSANHLEALRYLGRAMGLSPEKSLEFLASAGQSLGINFQEKQPSASPVEPFAHRIHSGNESRPIPFGGRDQELADLKSWVAANKSIAITGMGGVGKTRLAQEILLQTAAHFSLGCDALEVSANQTSLQLMHQVAELLGRTVTAEERHPAYKPFLLQDLRARLRSKNIAILIDNVEKPEQVRELIQGLPEITWIFTARKLSLRSVGIRTIALNPPSIDEAIDIFHKLTGRSYDQRESHEEYNSIREIARHVGQLPLALRLLAGLLESGIFPSIHELQQWLASKGVFKTVKIKNDLRIFFDNMMGIIPSTTRDIFTVCGVFSHFSIPVKMLFLVAEKLSIEIAPADWEILTDLAIISLTSDQVIKIHPLLHEYAKIRLKKDDRAKQMMLAYRQAYLETTQIINISQTEAQRNYLAFANDEAELTSLAEALYIAKDWAEIKTISAAYIGYLWSTGNFEQYEKFNLYCIDAAKELMDSHWEAVILAQLGFYKYEQHYYAKANAYYAEAQKLFDSRDDFLIEQARIRRYQALLAIAQGELPLADRLLKETKIRLDKVIDPAESRLPLSLLWFHTAQMRYYLHAGMLDQAEQEGLRAHEIHSTIKTDGGYRAIGWKIILGDVFIAQQRNADAIELWESEINRQINATAALMPDHADMQLRLAWLHAQDKDTSLALSLLSTCLQLYKQFANAVMIPRTQALEKAILNDIPLPTYHDMFGDA